jgi:4-hydroxybenzoate polyprenyltransferase
MIRFSHTLFALPFALLAAVMAWKQNSLELESVNLDIQIFNRFVPVTPTLEDDGRTLLQIGGIPMVTEELPLIPAWTWREVLGILLCMITARSAAMAFNRIADRKLDAENPRTAARHLPSGSLSLATVSLFAVFSSLAFVASTLLFLPANPLPLWLSVPVLLFLLGYSYTKRFTVLAHFWLGAALMLAPVCAWIAIRGRIVMRHPADLLPALVLGGAVLFWVAGFDIIYACQDAEFDRKKRLRSVPARLGVPTALRLAALCHAGTVALLVLLKWVFPSFGWLYLAGVGVIAALLIYEHWIVRPDDLTRVNVAFFNVNAVISLGLLLIATADLLLHMPGPLFPRS